MSTDLVNHMLRHVGDYVLNLDLYATLRETVTAQYAGLRGKTLLRALDDVIELHLSNAHVELLNRLDIETQEEFDKILNLIDEATFDKMVAASDGSTLGADLLLHAELLKRAGVTITLVDDLREMIDACSNQPA
jgi:hypothetical protein